MTSSKDPITAATKEHLWPYLQHIGFSKVSDRKYAREEDGIIQQLWVDANGIGGKRRTVVVLCANFVFGSVNGYMDPHGFRICGGKRWNMSSIESAKRAMQLIVNALRESELAKLDELARMDAMLLALKNFPGRDWFDSYSELIDRWNRGDGELLKLADSNRAALRLMSPNKSLNGDVAKATRR